VRRPRGGTGALLPSNLQISRIVQNDDGNLGETRRTFISVVPHVWRFHLETTCGSSGCVIVTHIKFLTSLERKGRLPIRGFFPRSSFLSDVSCEHLEETISTNYITESIAPALPCQTITCAGKRGFAGRPT
jgi:hypothetical protein